MDCLITWVRLQRTVSSAPCPGISVKLWCSLIAVQWGMSVDFAKAAELAPLFFFDLQLPVVIWIYYVRNQKAHGPKKLLISIDFAKAADSS